MPVFTETIVFKVKNGEKVIKLDENYSFNIQWKDTYYNNGNFYHLLTATSVPSCIKKIQFSCATNGNESILQPENECIFYTMYNTAILNVEYNNTEKVEPNIEKISEYRLLETMVSILSGALTTKELSDVIFHTNDSEKVYANRCILHSQSDILKALFEEQPEIPTEIEVNFSKDIVLRAMKFCYGKIDIIENCEGELINFADKYGIKQLKEVCLKSLELRILTCENICDIVVLAFQHNYTVLKDKCIEFLKTNKNEIGAEQISTLPNDILVSTLMSF